MINERITRNGEPIADDDLATVLTDLAGIERSLGRQPSYFELLTAAAFRWFADEAVDVAVVEVGLLGRWDATNVADGIVAVVTNVGHDHTDGQGDWRAPDRRGEGGDREARGHARARRDRSRAAPTSFAATPAAEVWRRGVDFDCVENRLAVGGRLLDIRTPGASYDEVFLPAARARTRATTPPSRSTAAEAFFGRALDDDIVATPFAVGARRRAASRWCSRDAAGGPRRRPQPRGAASPRSRPWPRTSTRLGERTSSSACCKDAIPTSSSGSLDAEAPPPSSCCTPDSPRGSRRPRWPTLVTRRRRACRSSSPDVAAGRRRRARTLAEPDDVVLVTGSLYVVGDAPRCAARCWSRARSRS